MAQPQGNPSSFEEMNLPEPLLQRLPELGFEKPTEVQQAAIVPLAQGHSFVVEAGGGTGKTTAIAISVLQRIDFTQPNILQALVIYPTRESALQAKQIITELGKHLAPAQSFCDAFIGGPGVKQEVEKLRAGGSAIGVGTPGRLLDLMERGAFNTDKIQVVVLEDGDKLLGKEFRKPTVGFFQQLGKGKQLSVFATSLRASELEIANQLIKDPESIPPRGAGGQGQGGGQAPQPHLRVGGGRGGGAGTGGGRGRGRGDVTETVPEVDVAPTPELPPAGAEGELQIFPTWASMSLKGPLLKAVSECGFEKPSAFQQTAILPLARGRGLVAEAPEPYHGTGKTVAVAIAVLQRVDFTQPNILQALVIYPTRESALQAKQIITELGKYLAPAGPTTPFCDAFVGGPGVKREAEKLKAGGLAIGVGTPGRLSDLMKRGAFNIEKIQVVVLEDGDKLLGKEFQKQTVELLQHMRKGKQVAVFAASLPASELEIAKKFIQDPVLILADSDLQPVLMEE